MIRWLFLLIALSAPIQVFARGIITNVATSCTGGYQGPGDVLSGAAFWYGLRGYSCAYAGPGTNKAVNIRRASDSNTTDVVILANGSLDIASAITFAGTDVTCTSASASASFTVSLAGCSGTPNIGDTILGTVSTGSIAGPLIVTSVGTFTGGAGTVVVFDFLVSPNTQTFALTTTTLTWGLYVKEVYDESGNAQNLVQAADVNQPQMPPSCDNSLPCFALMGNQWLEGGTSTVAQAWVETLVYNSTSTAKWLVGKTAGWAFGSSAGSDLLVFYAGAATQEAATSGVWHAALGQGNSALSQILVDGTGTGALSNANNSVSGPWALGALGGAEASTAFTGTIAEFGVWGSSFVWATSAIPLCHNQHLYWGTPTSC
jgi:hypothetical protein